MTYPNPDVMEFLSSRFVCYKLNIEETPPPDARALLRTVRLLWTPDFLFLEPQGAPIRRHMGYAPPDDFLGDLSFVLGQVAMVYRDYPRAVEHFETAAGSARTRAIAPEALFWKGVAAYKTGKDRAILRRHWDEIRERFGDSIWWTRAEASYGNP